MSNTIVMSQRDEAWTETRLFDNVSLNVLEPTIKMKRT